MRVAVEDEPTIVIPLVPPAPAPAPAAPPPPARPRPAPSTWADEQPVPTLPRPSILGPVLRAVLPALAVAALVGLAARGPVGAAVGAVIAVAAVGIALRRVILLADRGY